MCGRYDCRGESSGRGVFSTVVPMNQTGSPLQHRPTQPIPVNSPESQGARRELSLVRWGSFHHGRRILLSPPGLINARSETAATKPAFRDALKSRRCLIPADGFYEWLRHEATKYDCLQEIDQTRCSIKRYSTRQAILRELSKSSRTMNPTIHGYRNREGPVFLPASRRIGARVGGTVSKSKPS